MAKSRRDIMEFYPYPTPRAGHQEALEYIQKNRNNFDAMIIVAPTGSGKTAIRRAIASFYGDSCMLVPTNALIMQELEEFPQTVALMAKDGGHYEFPYQYQQALTFCQKRGVPILCVPHMMLARRLQRRTLIVDEGHRFIDFNKELQSTHAWRRDIGFPTTTYSRKDFEQFLKGRRDIPASGKLLEKLLTDDYMLRREKAALRGKYEDRIRLIPMSPSLHPSISGASQIILLSATINALDLKDLGIGDDKRIVKLELPSAIPADRRPLERAYVGRLNQGNLASMAPLLASRIRQLAEFHEGQKGIVHVTYQLATLLSTHLIGTRFLFHTQYNAKDRLAEWMASKDGVLIAAGMEEGLSLDGPEYEWQAICKIQYPSLGDSAIAKKARESEAWYTWQALRKVVQAYGRICRGENDWGVTYILDGMFDTLIEKSRQFNLIPQTFMEVL
jgi:Rad3-related DNA helicase